MGRPPAIKEGEIEELMEERDTVAFTTGEIAEAFDCHRKTAHQRLKKLEREGKVESDSMSQADAWFLAQNDPIISMPDGGDLLSLKEWFSTKMREFYPTRMIPLSLVTGLVAWFFASIIPAIVVTTVVYLTYPAVVLTITLVYMKLIKPRFASANDSSESIVA